MSKYIIIKNCFDCGYSYWDTGNAEDKIWGCSARAGEEVTECHSSKTIPPDCPLPDYEEQGKMSDVTAPESMKMYWYKWNGKSVDDYENLIDDIHVKHKQALEGCEIVQSQIREEILKPMRVAINSVGHDGANHVICDIFRNAIKETLELADKAGK